MAVHDEDVGRSRSEAGVCLLVRVARSRGLSEMVGVGWWMVDDLVERKMNRCVRVVAGIEQFTARTIGRLSLLWPQLLRLSHASCPSAVGNRSCTRSRSAEVCLKPIPSSEWSGGRCFCLSLPQPCRQPSLCRCCIGRSAIKSLEQLHEGSEALVQWGGETLSHLALCNLFY